MGRFFDKQRKLMEIGMKDPAVIKRFGDAGVEIAALTENLEDINALVLDYMEFAEETTPEENEAEGEEKLELY